MARCRTLTAGAASALAILSFSCAPSEPSTGRSQPNLLLISLDTFRADGISESGTGSTPALAALRTTSTEFSEAWSPVGFTLPAHMSALTSLHPQVHGVATRSSALNQRIPTLAEILSSAGYSTLGVATNSWMKGTFGFARGFDQYSELKYALTYADRVNQTFFDWYGTKRQGAPWMAFLHYVDAHSDFSTVGGNLLPYYAPERFLSGSGLERTSTRFCWNDECATDYLLAANRGDVAPTQGDIEDLHDTYRRGIEFLDQELGKLFQHLKDRREFDNTIIVLMSDHGEEFWEHGEFIHAQPYVETLKVPLLIKQVGQTERDEVEAPAELVDILPTVLSLLDLEHEAPMQGKDLFGPDLSGSFAFGRHKNRDKIWSARDMRYSLIHDFGADHSLFFDRQSDPFEAEPITPPADVRDRLWTALRRHIVESNNFRRDLGAEPVLSDSLLSERERKQLQAIGYVD